MSLDLVRPRPLRKPREHGAGRHGRAAVAVPGEVVPGGAGRVARPGPGRRRGRPHAGRGRPGRRQGPVGQALRRPASWPRPGSTASGSCSPCPTAASTPPTTRASTQRPLGLARPRRCASRRRRPTACSRWRCTRACPTRTRPLFDWPGPPGTWLDLADAHWLTTASLAAIAGEHPDGAVGRPPLPAHRPDRGRRRRASSRRAGPRSRSARWAARCSCPRPRCSMPSRAQPGLDRDKAIGTTIRDANANNLGVYATVTQSGTVRVGDSVHAS